MKMNDKLWEKFQALSSEASKVGWQVFICASDGSQHRTDMVNDGKLFICPHTILSSIAVAPRRFWGRMCQLSHDIAIPEAWLSREPSEIHDAGDQTPQRCTRLRCGMCVLSHNEVSKALNDL